MGSFVHLLIYSPLTIYLQTFICVRLIEPHCSVFWNVPKSIVTLIPPRSLACKIAEKETTNRQGSRKRECITIRGKQKNYQLSGPQTIVSSLLWCDSHLDYGSELTLELDSDQKNGNRTKVALIPMSRRISGGKWFMPHYKL